MHELLDFNLKVVSVFRIIKKTNYSIMGITAKKWVITKKITGLPTAEHFKIVTEELPPLQDGGMKILILFLILMLTVNFILEYYCFIKTCRIVSHFIFNTVTLGAILADHVGE